MSPSPPIRWGILGSGTIARTFLHSLSMVEDGIALGCASRTPGKAEALALEWDLPVAMDSYEALLAREDLDVVYVANTHNFHAETVALALNAGKAVLCEKPLTVRVEEARMLQALAKQRRLFLMEGMWTRFLPAVQQARDWVRNGAIGTPRFLRADFAFCTDFHPSSRLFNPDLAGGALLDVGIYPVSAARDFMGREPVEVVAVADLGQTGVDEQTAAAFRYDDGALALISASIRSGSENRFELSGTEGRLILPGPFYKAERAVLLRDGHDPETFHGPFEAGTGFQFEIRAIQEALRHGQIECDRLPVQESVEIAETMDRIRNAFGRDQAS